MVLDLFDQYATDEEAENNGTWREMGGGVELLVARSGNPAYARLLSKEVERHRKVLDVGDSASDERSEQIMRQVISTTVLLGWRTKQADGSYVPTIRFKGKDIEYSVTNAEALIKLKDLRREIVRMAEDISAFRVKTEVQQGEV